MHVRFPNCLSFIYIYMSMERTTLSTVYTLLSDSKIMSKCMLYMIMYNIYQHLCHMVFFIFPKNRLYYSNLFWLHISQKIPHDWTAIYHLSRLLVIHLTSSMKSYTVCFCLYLSQVCIWFETSGKHWFERGRDYSGDGPHVCLCYKVMNTVILCSLHM